MVVVVIGASRGIGYEIVRQLAQEGLTVVAIAHGHHSRGNTILFNLPSPNLLFHPLDIQIPTSISHFLQWFKNKFGALHILINNAAVNGVDVDYDYLERHNLDLNNIIKQKDFPKHVYRVEHDVAWNCIDVHYYGAKRTIEALFPLLQLDSHGGARIINVSSSYGLLKELRDTNIQEWMDKLENLSVEYIEEDFIKCFLEDVKIGEWSMDGKVWPSKHLVYKISKIALNAYRRLLAQEFQARCCIDNEKRSKPLSEIDWVNIDKHRRKIFIHCIHLDVVKTQLSFYTGDLSPVEGVDPIVRLALMPPEICQTGQFFHRYNVSNF